MATLSTICFQKFIKDLNAGKYPASLETQYQKIAIHAKAFGKKTKDFFTIVKFRELFAIYDVTKIISHYKAKQPKQLQLKI